VPEPEERNFSKKTVEGFKRQEIKVVKKQFLNFKFTPWGQTSEKKIGAIEQRLIDLGFRKTVGVWKKNFLIAPVYHQHSFGKSKPFKAWFELLWKKLEPIAIYDYSELNGAVCIVPTAELFKLRSVQQKFKKVEEDETQNKWWQPFSADDELGKLVFSFKDHWDLIEKDPRTSV
jgi:hypothetical protein